MIDRLCKPATGSFPAGALFLCHFPFGTIDEICTLDKAGGAGLLSAVRQVRQVSPTAITRLVDEVDPSLRSAQARDWLLKHLRFYFEF